MRQIFEPVGSRGGREFPGVIIASEKSEPRYILAATPHQLYRTARQILRDRYDGGDWYIPPASEDEHAEAETGLKDELRRLSENADSFDADDLGQRLSHLSRRLCESPGASDQASREWFDRMEQCLAMEDEHQAGKLAWQLLKERNGCEYEGIVFVSLEIICSGDRLDWLSENWYDVVPHEDLPLRDGGGLAHWMPENWGSGLAPTVAELYRVALESDIDVDRLVSGLIECQATRATRGPRPDFPKGSTVLYRGEERLVHDEVHAIGATWMVGLYGIERPVRADFCKAQS